MRLQTIWTLPAATNREKLRRTREWLDIKAANAIPRRILFWTYVRASRVIKDDEVVDKVTYLEVLERLSKD